MQTQRLQRWQLVEDRLLLLGTQNGGFVRLNIKTVSPFRLLVGRLLFRISRLLLTDWRWGSELFLIPRVLIDMFRRIVI